MRLPKTFYMASWGAAATTIALNSDFIPLEKNNPTKRDLSRKLTLQEKKEKASNLIRKTMVVHGIPGMSIGVSQNGKLLWSQGFGLANVESGSRCTGETVMRIASISKPITATIAAKLYENGKLDLDKDIREYLKDFPLKKYEGEDAHITTRQLLSHTSGIRHYYDNRKSEDQDEFLLNKSFKSVTEAIEMFKSDDLVHKPSQKFHYTTHGFTLASAVIEKAANREFRKLGSDLFNELGMRHTMFDNNSKIVNNRANYYRRNEKHVLENCPEVDCSYKLAGGGILSTVNDLLTFANAILYSTQNDSPLCVLKKSTIEQFLTPQINVSDGTGSALGWFNVNGANLKSMHNKKSLGGYFFHTGGSVGASSVLLIRPSANTNVEAPQGVCVAILCNLQGTSVLRLAEEIEEIFRD